MSAPDGENTKGRIEILVVEDEFFIAFELQRTLTHAGFAVLGPVSTIEDALDLLIEGRPHAAVLDVNIGREKVTPVAVELARLDIPFVLTTASTPRELDRYPILASANNLGKPTDATILIETLRALTDGV